MPPPPEVAGHGQRYCQRCTQPAGVDSNLCNDDQRTVRAALDPDNDGDRNTRTPASIPVYWARLDTRPGKGGDQGRRAPGFRSTPPCSLHVVAMRDPRSRPDPISRDDVDSDVRPVEVALANIARGLWDHLHLQGPDLPNGDITSGGVPGLAGWLHAHVADLVAVPEAAQVHDFLVRLVAQLRGPAGDPVDNPDAWCIDLAPRYMGDHELAQCGKPLYLPVPVPPEPGEPERSINPEAVAIRCKCGARYRWCDLVRLRLANQRDARERAEKETAA